jgi:capsule biosynthesis phosphatase
MGYERRVVVDLDDTISYTLNRDWENAEPIQPTIDKINQLYAMGWEVYIVTARGQLSCNGDCDAAAVKYRDQVEAWLQKHNVKYTVLSFNKILAAYYVDDKMLSPESFAQLDIEVLRQGQSGAVVERRGDRVFKTGDRVKNEAAWYLLARSYMLEYIPEVYSFVGSMLSLEFIKNIPPRMITGAHIEAVCSVLKKISMFEAASSSPFSTMVTRVVDHINGWTSFGVDPEKSQRLSRDIVQASYQYPWNKVRTFSHGDMSLDNILWSESGIKLIDPIFDPLCYSSMVLDAGKFLHSLRRQHRDQALATAQPMIIELISNRFSHVLDSPDQVKQMLYLAELMQWIRIIKYIPTDVERKSALDIVWELGGKL